MTEQNSVQTEQAKVQRPLTYKIYKGMGGKQGCFQFNLAPAYTSKKKDEGAVFIEAAPAIGKNQYDWDNKIVFALGATDIGTFLTCLKQGSFDIYHDPDAQTQQRGSRAKKLTLASGDTPGTFFIGLTETSGDTKKEARISLQPHEARILNNLLESALPRILGWS